MKKVIIMRGPSGAGKTEYIVRNFEGKCQVTVVSADHFFETRLDAYQGLDEKIGTLPGVSYEFDVAKLPQAHASCMEGFLQALIEEHEIVIVDNTSMRRWEYHKYELAACLAGYEVEIVEVMPVTVEELRLCAQRNKHGVPASIIAKMAMGFEPDKRALRVPVQE